MKRKIVSCVTLSLSALLVFGITAQADSPASKPWPTHAPDATPYVRVFDPEAEPPAPEPEPAHYDTVEDAFRSFYEEVNHFYFKDWELEQFRRLPQDEPYSFAPHSWGFSLDEGEAMRIAKLFAAYEGVEARVIAMHQLVDGLDDWSYTPVVTMTPARMFELSAEIDESFHLEQLYDSVRERFDIDWWPGGMSEEAEKFMREQYVQSGGFWFDPEELEAFRRLPPDEETEFWVRCWSPTGWEKNALNSYYALTGHDGCRFRLGMKDNSLESILLLDASPEAMFRLSEKTAGLFLITVPDEEVLAEYDLFFDPEAEVAPE